MTRKKEKTNHYASSPYKQIPDGLWLCPEFNAMKAHSRCLFMVMLAKWKWQTPEEAFVLTYDEATKITGFDRRRIHACIKELMICGFIEIPKRGSFPHNVSMYQINAEWLKKKYPRKQVPLPKYLRDFFNKDDA